jgi:hypothetical protein
MINIIITEQVTNFNYFGCHLGSNRNYDLQNKLQMLNYPSGTIKCTLLNKSQKETVLKFYTILAVSPILYGGEFLTSSIQHLQQIESCGRGS